MVDIHPPNPQDGVGVIMGKPTLYWTASHLYCGLEYLGYISGVGRDTAQSLQYSGLLQTFWADCIFQNGHKNIAHPTSSDEVTSI